MKRHDLDLVSLVFALVFLVYASLWPLWRLGILDQDNLGWVPATALIVIGVLGVALSIMRSRPRPPTAVEDAPPYVDQPTSHVSATDGAPIDSSAEPTIVQDAR